MTPPQLKILVNVVGVIVFLAHVSIALLSSVQAPVLWQQENAPRAKAFFEGIGAGFPEASMLRHAWLTVRSVIPGGDSAAIPGLIPLAIASLAFIALYFVFMRKGAVSGPELERVLLRWSIAFAAVSLFAYPVFTQDFWLSAAWGRMVANGQNPYHQLFGEAELTSLPLDHFAMPMTYGPLWALISGAVMTVFNGYVWGIFIAFKAVLAVLWIGALYLIPKLMAHLSARERGLGILMFGWLPFSVSQTVAEGHNDIALAVFALLWLHFLVRNSSAAPFALAASALCKYGSAPLFLLDLLYSLKLNRMPFWRYSFGMVLPGIAVLLIFAIYFQSSSFFSGLIELSTWRALRTVDAIMAMEIYTGIPLALVQLAVYLFFPVFAAWKLYSFVRAPTLDAAFEAALAIMCAVIFTGVSHLWPWYMIWPLAFAALRPGWWLSRFVMGVAMLAPFTLIFWWIASLEAHKDTGALIMYAGALLWMLLTREIKPGITPAIASATYFSMPQNAGTDLNNQPNAK